MAEDLPAFKRGDRLTAEELNRICRRVWRGIRGDGLVIVTDGAEGVAIGLALQALLPLIPKPQDWFFGRITASAADGSNRWKYSFEEVTKATAGYTTWVAKYGGRTGTTARNGIECPNAATGRLGNGATVANLDPVGGPYSFTLQPAPAGVVGEMRPVELADGTHEYWFQYENGVDGTCD